MGINSINMYISEENYIHNINHLKQTLSKDIIPVVKANAYGHDINLITELLVKNNINLCAVARFREAEQILKNINVKNKIKILIFETIDNTFFEKIINNSEFLMTANSITELKTALDFGVPPEKIQIKLDLGFARNGIISEELPLLKSLIQKNDYKFSGIYSHLFSIDYDAGLKIISNFTNIITDIGKQYFSMIHLQNSASIENFNSIPITTHIRPGMLTYGLQEEGYYNNKLKQVFSLKGTISAIKDISNISFVAYTSKPSLNLSYGNYIAKIKIGYGDGFLKLNEGSKVIIKNKEFPITLITMDNTFIEVDSSILEGDEVILYPNISLLPSTLNINSYELLTILSQRLERILF